jgi:hypothetical protein
MNFHMIDMEKSVAELHVTHKRAEDSIKKNPNHVMMVQKEKKKRKRWTPPKGKCKERFPMSPRAVSLRQKASLTLLLMRNASTTTRRDIGSEIVRSTWRSRRERRKVRLPLQL